MKVLVFSDSHGNTANMEKMIGLERPDQVLHLGDGYRDAQEIAARFPQLPVACVPGDERLGPDRAVADIAAIEKYGAPLIVLDFGTATTVDALSAEGSYLGGCITAGVRISVEALFQKAAMLPNVELTVPDTVLGCTAVGQIQAGAVMGYIGSIEYLIRRTKAEMGYPEETIKVVATGGLARMVADHTPLIDIVDSRLILDGLHLIYQREKARETV